MKSRQGNNTVQPLDSKHPLLSVKCKRCGASKGQKCTSMSVDGKQRLTWDEAVNNVRRKAVVEERRSSYREGKLIEVNQYF